MIRRLVVAALVMLSACIVLPARAHAVDRRASVGYMLNMPDLPGWWTREIAIRDALTLFGAATGQDYRFDGYTTWTPTIDTIDQAPDDLVIDVDTPHALDMLRIQPGVAGYTLTTPSHAVIALDYWQVSTMPAGIDLAAGRTVLVLTEHELGHTVGMPHTSGDRDVMNPNLTGGPFYTPAEYATLATVGCRP